MVIVHSLFLEHFSVEQHGVCVWWMQTHVLLAGMLTVCRPGASAATRPRMVTLAPALSVLMTAMPTPKATANVPTSPACVLVVTFPTASMQVGEHHDTTQLLIASALYSVWWCFLCMVPLCFTTCTLWVLPL
jgi:uncharacterized membrane protein YhaH (DUF805 family)